MMIIYDKTTTEERLARSQAKDRKFNAEMRNLGYSEGELWNKAMVNVGFERLKNRNDYQILGA